MQIAKHTEKFIHVYLQFISINNSIIRHFLKACKFFAVKRRFLILSEILLLVLLPINFVCLCDFIHALPSEVVSELKNFYYFSEEYHWPRVIVFYDVIIYFFCIVLNTCQVTVIRKVIYIKKFADFVDNTDTGGF